MDKNSLRTKYKALRDTLTPNEVAEQSLLIANKALTLPIWNRQYYHVFLSITSKKEVDTDYLLHILQGKDKSVVIARSNFENNTMQHILLEDSTEIRTSTIGIPEPTGGIEIPARQLDVIFVPLLAFDKNGHRIGYGKGFYDRFLASCSPNAIFVGLSFYEPEPEIPFSATDIPLHYAVTPVNTFTF
ncbi:MAG: 5-formyltetrahydrofolate cyclo-ligase [Flavobacteriaceae bacterium]|nr:5-formyltetrahydrofolate cyclo-ligase [Flavobacteriaceae bacterium]